MFFDSDVMGRTHFDDPLSAASLAVTWLHCP